MNAEIRWIEYKVTLRAVYACAEVTRAANRGLSMAFAGCYLLCSSSSVSRGQLVRPDLAHGPTGSPRRVDVANTCVALGADRAVRLCVGYVADTVVGGVRGRTGSRRFLCCNVVCV
jgi:hypothetical protein